MSEREPELGLGVVARLDLAERRIGVSFPATGENRLYALGTTVLRRVQFAVGETIATRDGARLHVDTIEDRDGLFTYVCGGRHVREDQVSDVTSVALPQERLLAGQADPGEVFDLRLHTLEEQARLRQSELRGFLGGRLELLPHQFHILNEVSSRQLPRVLLADEVGLGKTIEACLILQRLLATGQTRRALILVPESLTHQWFVELLRRFSLWFTIFDVESCHALEAGNPGQNPFLSSQLALASTGFLSTDETRRAQVLEGAWDMVVVDEAHHLQWTPEEASPAYRLVEELALRSRGLLLLTATPTQLGLTGHFARLRLLDPHRFDDLARFRAESERYETVAAVAEKIIAGKTLTQADRKRLTAIFDRDPAGLARHLEALSQGKPGARAELLRTLLDQHGTGRVVFRNTRAAMSGFPPRRYRPVPLDSGNNLALLARVARELAAEEDGTHEQLRYSFRDDPRVQWLAAFLEEHRGEKVLLICRTQRKVLALASALQEKTNVGVGLFHEGLPLVQRDRNAAWFAEPDGAQLLLCSEIGSEGRNFQFAHHLVLLDLPPNPGLLEQRIGRLDRIGQRHPILIHVPYLVGSATECLADWHHRGLDAFETSQQGSDEYLERFGPRLLALAAQHGTGVDAGLEALISETAAFRAELQARLQRGRDRLLELNSFDATAAGELVERIRTADTDLRVRRLLTALLDHFGVRIRDHEEGDLFLDPTHAYIEGFPSIPREGMLTTFNRARSIAREDIRFLSADHPLVRDAIDLLVDSSAGTTAFGCVRAPKPNLLLETVYLLETVADTSWQVDRFLAPTPVRVVVDLRGQDLTEVHEARSLAERFEDAPLARFLERPGFNAKMLKGLLAAAEEKATERSTGLKTAARERAATALGASLNRLLDLQRVNDQIRPEEVALAREQLERTGTAIGEARLRLDSLRLILEGPVAFGA